MEQSSPVSQNFLSVVTWRCAHQGRGHDGRGGLREDHRSTQGHDHPGRGEHLPDRDRELPPQASQDRRRSGEAVETS